MIVRLRTPDLSIGLPELRHNPRDGTWVAIRGGWIWDHLGACVWIEEGFEAKASIPPLLRWVVDQSHLSPFGFALHDQLYRYRGRPPQVWTDPPAQIWSRSQADRAFEAVNVGNDVTAENAREAWWGVRLGGWWPWWREGRPAY